MAGNCFEWVTETYSLTNSNFVTRGSFYVVSNATTDIRQSYGAGIGNQYKGFRPILYL